MEPLYVQILLIFVALLFAGILTGLIICSLGDDSPKEAMCGWFLNRRPRRRRRLTIGPNGEEVETLEDASTESYDGPPLDPVSRSKEKREPLSFELESRPPTAPSAGTSHGTVPHAPHAPGRTGSHGSGGAHGGHSSHGHRPHH